MALDHSFLAPEPTPEQVAALEAFSKAAARIREAHLEAAQALRIAVDVGALQVAAISGPGELAVRNGLPPWVGVELDKVAKGLRVDPTIGDEIRAGTLMLPAAADVGEATQWSPAWREKHSWTEIRATASTMPFREFHRTFQRWKAELRAGVPVRLVSMHVTEEGWDDMSRVRQLKSRTAHEVLTLGEVTESVFREWRLEHDPEYVTPGERKVPDTSERPGDRYVPREVDREVRQRFGDRCAVPGCDNIFWLDRSHRIPHRAGGCREAFNIDLLCNPHHGQYETGYLIIEGPPDKPVFKDMWGRVIDEKHPQRHWPPGTPCTPPEEDDPPPDDETPPKEPQRPATPASGIGSPGTGPPGAGPSETGPPETGTSSDSARGPPGGPDPPGRDEDDWLYDPGSA